MLLRPEQLPSWVGAATSQTRWVDLRSLDEQMECQQGADDKRWASAVAIMFDAALHIDRARHPQYVPSTMLRTELVCCAQLLDPELDLHVESAAFFAPLSSVKLPIVQTITKHGVKQRCQGRSAENMAMKRIVTRELEQQGRMKRKTLTSNRYQGYVLRSCKEWMLCSLLGNYDHVDPDARPKHPVCRRRLYEVFTDKRYERWVVNLLHRSIDVLTACIREFVAHSVNYNPPLKAHVGELIQIEQYEAITQRGLLPLRAYFARALMDPASDLFLSFRTLPAHPCSLQRFFVCGRTDCGLPCPHKFMKAKEVKSSTTVSGVAMDVDMLEEQQALVVTLIEEMSSDRAIVVQHRKEEVEREQFDARQEEASGWQWRTWPFHSELTTLMAHMEIEAAKLSYSRPWKLDVLFGARRRGAAAAASATADWVLSDEERSLVRYVVRWCGPVGRGEPMGRIVSFFRFFGVDRKLVSALKYLVKPSVREGVTENRLRVYMDVLRTHQPRVAALLREAWEAVCDAEDHFLVQELPLNIAESQALAVQQVHHGIIPCDSPVCLVFCPACEIIYTPLVDDTSMYRKHFRYGLRGAGEDALDRGKSHCTHRDAKTKRQCNERLVFLPLVGRALRWKRRTSITMCCQPKCARFMVFDRSADMHWNQWGFSCHRCLIAQKVAAAKRFYDVEFLFSHDSAPAQCALIHNHEDDKPNKRWKDKQLHILLPQLYICSKCFTPSMADRVREHPGCGYEDALRMLTEEDDQRRRRLEAERPAREQRRRKQLIAKTARNPRR